MAVEILGYEIENVAIIDDEPSARRGYSYTVQDADLVPLPIEGPLPGSAAEYLNSSALEQTMDAGVCDFRLSARPYASFSGAELVAELYHRQLPALLCTRYDKAAIHQISPYRRWIPILLTPSDLNADSLVSGFHECIYELQGNFRSARRPWRSQVHFLSEDEESPGIYFAEVPGWDLNEIIRVRLDNLPPAVRKQVGPEFRCYAYVNLGAESYVDLYLYNWELA